MENIAACPPSDTWRDALRDRFGQEVYSDWLRHLRWSRVQEDTVYFTVQNSFVRDWIHDNYFSELHTVLLPYYKGCTRLLIEVLASDEELISTADFSAEEDRDIDLDPRFTFENFVVGKPNEFAYAAARRVADCQEATYNPLFLYGPVGHGKTHLMHSIAHHILQKSNHTKKILYLSAEKFMYHFIKALRYKDIVAFKDRFRAVDVLMIDDVQFISGKEATQEEFFHTFNALVDQKRQVVISADKSPADLEGIQERMKSRLGWGLVADLHPTTYELRLGILQTKSAQLGAAIPKDVLALLAAKISSNVRELEGALNRIAAHALLIGREITVDMAYEVLKDLLRSYDRAVTIDDIQKKVADYYRIRVNELHSIKRSRHIARPRQIAMFLAKQMTTTSLPNIGRYFGGRDHTTVIHAIQKIQALAAEDATMRNDLALLRRSIENC